MSYDFLRTLGPIDDGDLVYHHVEEGVKLQSDVLARHRMKMPGLRKLDIVSSLRRQYTAIE